MANKNKVRAVGTQRVSTVPVRMGYKNLNTSGFVVWELGAPALVIDRRIGPESSISYQTGNDGAFRPCDHTSASYVSNPVPDTVVLCTPLPPSTGYSFCAVTGLQRAAHIRRYPNFISGVNSVSTDVDSIDWNGLGSQALAAMMPSFGGKNSLLNFLFELRDFRKLATALSQKCWKWLQLLEAAIGYKRKNSTLKNLSAAYLSYNFAWKPLYTDLVDLVSALLDLDKQIKKYIKEANTDLQKHFSILVSGTGTSESQYYYSGDEGPQGGWIGVAKPTTRSRVVIDACEGVRFNATLRYRYPLPETLTAAGGRARALLDALGIAKDPAIIWNAIPFTFVIDWVVNVGRWLSQMRVDNIRFQTEIRDFCCSAVITRNVRYEQQVASTSHTPSNVTTFNWGSWVLTDACRKRRYVRRKVIPNLLSAIQVSGLNPREFSLAGALLGANSGSRRRKR